MYRNPASESLLDWIYWMVIDILESGEWEIVYRYVYDDKKRKSTVTPIKDILGAPNERYQRLDACVDLDCRKIFIGIITDGEKELCLFHECLEILFDEWKQDYYTPGLWGLEENQDPILALEAATWKKLTQEQKDRIKLFLPKGP